MSWETDVFVFMCDGSLTVDQVVSDVYKSLALLHKWFIKSLFVNNEIMIKDDQVYI